MDVCRQHICSQSAAGTSIRRRASQNDASISLVSVSQFIQQPLCMTNPLYHEQQIPDVQSCVSIRLFPLIYSRHSIDYAQLLLVFMTVLAQSFFTLVRCHLVAFAFLSVWHVVSVLMKLYYSVAVDTRVAITSPGP